MTTFAQTINPTPFGIFDSDQQFQADADKMVIFVKRALGDDILSVELTKKQIWSCFEQATLEYNKVINEYTIKSQLSNLLGQSTGSNVDGTFPRQTLEFLFRMSEAYSTEAGVGGSYESTLGYITLENARQDYHLYNELRNPDGTLMYRNLDQDKRSRLRIMEIYHFNPIAAQHFLLNASNITNFLAQEMRYESYVNSTVFYVLPIFEDVLRRSMLDAAHRLRRSNYSYSVYGPNIRIYPTPNDTTPLFTDKMWVRVRTKIDPLNPDYGVDENGQKIQDSSIHGSITDPSNVPFSNIPYSAINAPGKQWIRDFTLSLSTILLGRIRSKMKSIPIPGADLQLNGEDLVAQGREDKNKLLEEIKAMMDELTYDKLVEKEANKSESLNKQLKFVPMPLGKSIIAG